MIMIILTGCLFLFSACGSVEETSVSADIHQSVEDDISYQNLEYNQADNKLVLLDFSSNSTVKEIQFDDTEIIDSYDKITDGYAVVKSTYAQDVNNAKEIDGIVISKSISDEKSAYEYISYDEQLQETAVIDLKELISEELLSEIQEGSCEPQIDPIGQKIAWSTESGIYVLNLNTGEQMVHEIEEDEFTRCEISFVDENTVGFYRTTGDTTITTRYGYWDLVSNELFYEDVNDYMPFSIRVSGEYFILNDGEDETGTSSGKVLIYDCEKNQSTVISVNNTESTLAFVTSDGKNLIAYSCTDEEQTEHKICVYELPSGECVSETPFTTTSRVLFDNFSNIDNMYLLIGIGDTGKVVYDVFTTQ